MEIVENDLSVEQSKSTMTAIERDEITDFTSPLIIEQFDYMEILEDD